MKNEPKLFVGLLQKIYNRCFEMIEYDRLFISKISDFISIFYVFFHFLNWIDKAPNSY